MTNISVPCKDCIVFPICRQKAKRGVSLSCTLLDKYVYYENGSLNDERLVKVSECFNSINLLV
jgi:hypothetical protein